MKPNGPKNLIVKAEFLCHYYGPYKSTYRSYRCPNFYQVLSKFHLKINLLTSQTTESQSEFSEIHPFR